MTNASSVAQRRPDGAALIIGVVLAVAGAILIWQGRSIPDKGGYAGIGSGDMPVFIGCGLLALAVAHVAKGLRVPADAVPRQQSLPILLIVGGLFLQLIMLNRLGFSIASGVLFACTAAAFGKRNLLVTIPVGFAFALGVFAVFDQLLKLNLPAGLPETLLFGG